jgi:RHS repeat-associated protein
MVSEQNFTSIINEDYHYCIPMAAESKTWEVRKDIAANTYYTKSDFDIFIDSGLSEVAYHASLTFDESKRLIEHSYITYLKEDNINELELFEPNKRGLVYQQYQLAFNHNLLSPIFDTHATDIGNLAEANGFIKIGDLYWLPSGRAVLSDVPPADFYLPKSFLDPMGNETLVNYETDYHLYIKSVEDALANITSLQKFNYRVMAPNGIIDINENNSYFSYDVLGRLSAMALGAKGQADDLNDCRPILTQSERDTFFASPREEAINYLVHATAAYVYDQHSIPAKVASIVRERHYYDVVRLSLDDKTMCSFEYSNGFGQVVLKKVQAERGNVLIQNGSSTPTTLKPGTGQWLLLNNTAAPAPYDAMEPHRWVGTGRIVFNNKGNPVKQYEPYFSITHYYEDDLQIVQIGVSPEIYYDALGRNIKTVMPDGTFTKVVYKPWHQELWDAGDTVIDSAWYSTRQALGIIDPYNPDYIASEKSEAYANTPQTIYFDNLGRPVCNKEQLIYDSDVPSNEVFVYTQLKLDIEGNLLHVIDGLDRQCMAFKYNMLGQRLYQTHIDSGERWNMTNAMGKPLWQFNSKGTIFTFTYDALNRPLDFNADDGTTVITYQKMEYGEGTPDAAAHNRNGKLFILKDGSGASGFKDYDFKGNNLYSSKDFVLDVAHLPNWNLSVDMAFMSMSSTNLFDALNRPISIDAGDKITQYTYNEAGLPETVIVDDGSDNLIVESISYNAKGQREFIEFGNDTYSEYFYDEKTFRLKRIITQRDADTEPLQDINYVYDAVGNIVYVKDNAQQTFYFDNSIINPESFYTYDALYRLIEATGRENFNNTGFYEVTTPQGLGGNDVQNYERSFEYDVVGNITKMQHAASANSFTKHFHYDNSNNQLTRIFIGNSVSALESYTYDEHGNMLASYDRQFTYNLLDQLQVVDITGGSWKAFYMYNAEGQRDRKIILNSAGTKDRAYFQKYELYREFDNADDLVLERYTHHISDGEKKVATLDQKTGNNTMYRYQYGNNLGSVGLELDDSAAIISYEEYYPFGGTSYYAHNHHIDVPKKRYKYCGKEQDEETGLYYYGARYYAPWLCRFTSVDPKTLEYVHQSSYVFADNNPVVKYDVNGEGTNGDGTAGENQPQVSWAPVTKSENDWHVPMALPKNNVNPQTNNNTSPQETNYTVKEGDTLSEIAKSNGISLDSLRTANNLDSKNDKKLQIGTKLTIPVFNKNINSTSLANNMGYSVTVTDVGENINAITPKNEKKSHLSAIAIGGKVTGNVGFIGAAGGLTIKSSNEAIASIASGEVSGTKKINSSFDDLLKFETGLKASVELGFTFTNSDVDPVANGAKISTKISETTGINLFGTGITIKTEYNTKSGDRTYKVGFDIGAELVSPFYRKVTVNRVFEGTSSERYKTIFNSRNYPINGN